MKFSDKVYEVVKIIPKGKVTTYGEIAHVIGVRAYQAVGNVLSKNNKGFHKGGNVPCHRVVPKNGTLGGFCGQKCGELTCIKKKLLEEEGIIFDENNKIKDFQNKIFHF